MRHERPPSRKEPGAETTNTFKWTTDAATVNKSHIQRCFGCWEMLHALRFPHVSNTERFFSKIIAALQILEGCSFYIAHKAKKLQNWDILIIVKWIQPYIHCQNLPFKINTLQKKRLVFKWIYLVCKALHDCNQELKVIFEALLMAVMGMLHTKENWIRIIHAKLLRLLWQIGYDDHVCRTVARHCKCIGKA